MSLATLERSFEQRLDQCWLSVMAADVLQMGTVTGWKTISRDVRAGAVVMAMGEFEALLKNCVEETHDAIESSGSSLKEVRAGVRMLHFDGRFTSAAGGGSSLDTTWETRLLLAETHTSDLAPRLPRRDGRGNLQPVGSQTPRPSTVSRLWLVYDLPGDPFPKIGWRKSLGELAEIRNDVAHARLPLAQAFAGKGLTADAIAQSILNLRDLGKHVAESFAIYTVGGGFLV